MHDTILTMFLKLSLYPTIGVLGSGGVIATSTTLDDESSVSLGLLFTVIAILITVGMAVGVGLWKLATILSSLNTEVSQARDDRAIMFKQLDHIKQDFATFSARCPAQAPDGKCSTR